MFAPAVMIMRDRFDDRPSICTREQIMQRDGLTRTCLLMSQRSGEMAGRECGRRCAELWPSGLQEESKKAEGKTLFEREVVASIRLSPRARATFRFADQSVCAYLRP